MIGGRDVDQPVKRALPNTIGAATDSSGEPVRPGPRSLEELEDTLSAHGLFILDAIEKKLLEFQLTDTLTRREIEILRFAAEGMTMDQTAEWLEISRETVRTHRMNALRKLHVHTVTGAVGMAYRAGVLP